MHAEPEAFTNPAFPVDLYPQIESIAKLLSSLDPNINLAIKEHPALFGAYPQEDPKYISQNRPPLFFEHIAATPQTFLINSKSDARALIEKSKFVFCGCGSVGFQAIFSRKVVVGIPFSPLYHHPGFVDINSVCSSSITKAQDALLEMDDDKLIQSILALASPGSPNGSFNMLVEPNEILNSILFSMSLVTALQNKNFF